MGAGLELLASLVQALAPVGSAGPVDALAPPVERTTAVTDERRRADGRADGGARAAGELRELLELDGERVLDLSACGSTLVVALAGPAGNELLRCERRAGAWRALGRTALPSARHVRVALRGERVAVWTAEGGRGGTVSWLTLCPIAGSGAPPARPIVGSGALPGPGFVDADPSPPPPTRSWQYIGGETVSSVPALSGDVHVDPTTGDLFVSCLLDTGRVKVRQWLPGIGAWSYLGTNDDPLTSAAVGTKICWYNHLDSIAGVPAFSGRSYAVAGGASVRRYDPQANLWTDVGAPGSISQDEAHYVQLHYTSQGVPVVAYQDRSTSPPDQTTVEWFDAGSQSWKAFGAAGINGAPATFQSLDLDLQDRPVVAFADSSKNGRVVVLRWDPQGSTWTPLGGPNGVSPEVSVANTQVHVRPNGGVLVAYRYLNQYVQVLAYDEPSNTWSPFGSGYASAADPPEIETETWRNWVPIASSGEAVYVGYQLSLGPGDPDDGKAVVRTSSGGEWEPVGTVGFSEAGAYYLMLALGPDGTPYVSFRNAQYSFRYSVMGFVP